MDIDNTVMKAWEGQVWSGGGQWDKKHTKSTSVILATIKINFKKWGNNLYTNFCMVCNLNPDFRF